MAKYLDEQGLQKVWDKIKTMIASGGSDNPDIITWFQSSNTMGGSSNVPKGEISLYSVDGVQLTTKQQVLDIVSKGLDMSYPNNYQYCKRIRSTLGVDYIYAAYNKPDTLSFQKDVLLAGAHYMYQADVDLNNPSDDKFPLKNIRINGEEFYDQSVAMNPVQIHTEKNSIMAPEKLAVGQYFYSGAYYMTSDFQHYDLVQILQIFPGNDILVRAKCYYSDNYKPSPWKIYYLNNLNTENPDAPYYREIHEGDLPKSEQDDWLYNNWLCKLITRKKNSYQFYVSKPDGTQLGRQGIIDIMLRNVIKKQDTQDTIYQNITVNSNDGYKYIYTGTKNSGNLSIIQNTCLAGGYYSIQHKLASEDADMAINITRSSLNGNNFYDQSDGGKPVVIQKDAYLPQIMVGNYYYSQFTHESIPYSQLVQVLAFSSSQMDWITINVKTYSDTNSFFSCKLYNLPINMVDMSKDLSNYLYYPS